MLNQFFCSCEDKEEKTVAKARKLLLLPECSTNVIACARIKKRKQ